MAKRHRGIDSLHERLRGLRPVMRPSVGFSQEFRDTEFFNGITISGKIRDGS
jgi:hypothetical protein